MRAAVVRPPVFPVPTERVGAEIAVGGGIAVGARPGASWEELFEAAFAAHHGELLGFLLHATRDLAVAEDLEQEAFLRLFRELQCGRPPDNVRAWLYRVAANLVVSRGRRASVARRWLERTGREEDWFDSPERMTVDREDRDRLMVELASLSRDARVGLLMAANGFSGREIAAALGRTDVATRTMLCRARMRLRLRLEHR